MADVKPMIEGEAAHIYDAYLTMAARANYRPAAPGDGLGNIMLSTKQLDDPQRLAKEAAVYAKRFIAEEDGRTFHIGVSNFRTNHAFVYVIEAARCLCGGADDVAATLLKMASDEIGLWIGGVGAVTPIDLELNLGDTPMPSKIVDLSARSKIIRDEPFHVHFWECTPEEFLDYLKNPRPFLTAMGINVPEDCRIETTIENHDWIGKLTHGLTRANGTIICNIGGGNVARSVYRIVSYGHDHSSIAKYQKELLHSPAEEQK